MRTGTVNSKSGGCGCSGGGTSAKPCGCGSQGCAQCSDLVQGYTRPLFFSGQLLTEDDLQSLVDYVVGKNRLHNRMLFGAGVACGLQVSVDGCDATKIEVSPGYAIDCCGDDIVVPCDVELDINQLIRDLRLRVLGKDCGPPCAPLDPKQAKYDPAGVSTSYCLYVVYCEQAGDPVAPYDGETTCGGGDCRDTRVQEGFRFELRCPPAPPAKAKRPQPGSVYARATPLAAEIVAATYTVYDNFAPDKSEALLSKLHSYITSTGGPAEVADSIAAALVSRMQFSSREQLATYVSIAVQSWLRGLDCKELSGGCDPCDDDGVLIACMDVENCTVGPICNAERMTLLTPAYLGRMGVTDWWQGLLHRACCDPRPVHKLPDPKGEIGAFRGELNAMRELNRFVEDRLAEIGDSAAPEARYTLLPHLARKLGATVTRTQAGGSEKRERELQQEIDEVEKKLHREFESELQDGLNTTTAAYNDLVAQVSRLEKRLSELEERPRENEEGGARGGRGRQKKNEP